MEKNFASIDLKSFYASVECRERGLDPLTTNLVVADESRTDKTICLAISPALKTKYHLPGRARLFEVRQKVPEDFIVARPRMQYYLDYSRKIYQTYLKYLAPADIFAYSVDEVFCDLTHYLKMYHMSAAELVTTMINDVYQTTGITATAGIGTNMFLCKVAMDILAKHAEPNAAGVRLAQLDELNFRKQLWTHQPITDFWRVGPGYAKRLATRQMRTMGDVARCSLTNPELLYQMFGVNAELLIDHAWGHECVEIQDVKNYRPEHRSLSSGQVLARPYNFDEARTIVKEMSEAVALDLSRKNLLTDQLVLHLSYDSSSLEGRPTYSGPTKLNRYGHRVPKSAHGTLRLAQHSSSSTDLRSGFLELYNRYVDPDFFVRRLNLTVGNLFYTDDPRLLSPRYQQLNLFRRPSASHPQLSSHPSPERESKIQRAILEIRRKFGNNAILRGTNFEDCATMRQRHQQIGGHQA